MGCPNEVQIGDSLVFSICTHDADTGALTDASSSPAYRVYENETAIPILTGAMAILDGVNTTGFYSAEIDCTIANGFENGKTYTIYIEATVDGIIGGITYAFKAYTLMAANLSGSGAIAWSYTLTESDTGNPIADADVWISSDIAGSNIIASGKTNQNGVVAFYLDAGTVYVWRQKTGYDFVNPDTEAVS